MRRGTQVGLMLTMFSLAAPLAAADNWPQFRGPSLNGSTTLTALPDKLDPATNLLWKADMPGLGSCTPVVHGDKVFVTSLDQTTQKLVALCLDAKTGAVLWRRDVGDGIAATDRSNTASPSAITDGKTVWFYFGSGDLVAFDMEGKQLWARNLVKEFGPFNVQWIYGSSPLLHFGKLYVQVIHRDVPPRRGGTPTPPQDSYLLAVDPATGKDIFRHVRTTPARAESKESYSTPIPSEASGRKEVLVYGGDCLTAHDADTGAELWRFSGWNTRGAQNFRVVPTPVVMDDKIIICTPQAQGVIIAVKAGGSGDVSATHKLWEISAARSDVCSPVVYQNQLFTLDGDFRKGLTSLDPATGQPKWFTPVNSRPVLRSSPTAADGKIYFMNESAEVWVVSAADGKILSNTQLPNEGGARGAISVAQGRIYVRTGNALLCFGANP